MVFPYNGSLMMPEKLTESPSLSDGGQTISELFERLLRSYRSFVHIFFYKIGQFLLIHRIYKARN